LQRLTKTQLLKHSDVSKNALGGSSVIIQILPSWKT